MANEKIEVCSAGTLLFSQGEAPEKVYYLKKGVVELLNAPESMNGLDPALTASKSSRVSLIRQGGIVPPCSIGLTEAHGAGARALTDCEVSFVQVPQGGISRLASADPASAAWVIRGLILSVASSAADSDRLLRLWRSATMMSDNLCILYGAASGRGLSERLQGKASSLFANFTSSGGALPSPVTARFLITDNSRYLSRRYNFSGEPVENLINRPMIDMISRIVNQPASAGIIGADPEIAASMLQLVTASQSGVIGRIESLCDQTGRELADLFGAETSWSSYLTAGGGFNQIVSAGLAGPEFVKQTLSLIVKMNSMYEEIFGVKMTSVYPGIREIHVFYTAGGAASRPVEAEGKKSESAAASVQTSAGNAGPVPGLQNSLRQILEYTLADKDFQAKFIKLLKDFKAAKNPLATDSGARKLRRHITKMYWDMYKQAFIRSKGDPNTPVPVKMMLSFGLLDETLLDNEHQNELWEIAALSEKKTSVPVVRETDFLSLILQGKEAPSITEMGLSYDAHLREEERHRGKKGTHPETADPAFATVMYEIEQRLASTSAVCSGSTSTAIPFLCSFNIHGSLKSMYMAREAVDKAVREIRDIDFSLFYRETVLKLEDAREIIREEILPYFILLPVSGSRTLLWQELSGTNKRSRGRIVIPVFFAGDFQKNLAHTLACFRWELNRSLKGAMWADPIEGGVTGEYFDYVNTFKKNSKLSVEAKDKINEKFKSIRTNRDRFADDYQTWVLFEKDGIMKLNSVVREMFFKHIPFKKDIRERLGQMPAFGQYNTRYTNILIRNYQSYERRYKKYMDSEGNYPVEIKKYMEFLQM